VCPHEDCQGRHLVHHQAVDKLLKDRGYRIVIDNTESNVVSVEDGSRVAIGVAPE
jgi:hypothetical protein